MADNTNPPKEEWGSKLGVILAVAGSAVGLGNFLRFPGKAADYGGGAFMIPYFCALLFLGIPICWVEWTMGRRGGRFGFNSAPGIFSVLWKNPISPYLGSIGLMIPVVIYMYYVYIESWCLMYACYYLFGAFDEFGANTYAFSDFFNKSIGAEADGSLFANGIAPLFWFFLATFLVNFVVIYRGLSRGIETFCKWALPMLIVAALVLVVRVLTLPEQPAASPWQRGLSQVISADEWSALRDRLIQPALGAPEGVSLIKAKLAEYCQQHAHDADQGKTTLLLAPPVGFLETAAGLAVARAEIRNEKRGQAFVAWIQKTREALSTDQKIELGRLERKQSRLEYKKINDPVAVAAIEQARETILKSPTSSEPMPSLTEEMQSLGIDEATAKRAQHRSAAIELADLPRTVANGLGYMWNPDFKELSNPEVWLESAGQIFFSLSVGFGVILNYASYLRRKDDVVLSGLSATATNEFCEVCLGGMVAIPATFVFLGTAMTIDVINKGSTFGLGFTTLPTVFAGMPWGRWFAVAWFGLLFLAGITSSLSMLQPAIAFLEEGFGLKRRASVAGLGFVTLIGALAVVYFSHETTVLSTMDYWVGTFMIYMLAMIQVILFGWVIGMEEGMKEAHLGAQMTIPRIFRFVIKYVTPAYLLIIFVAWLFQNAPAEVAKIRQGGPVLVTVIAMVAFFAFLNLTIYLAVREWRGRPRPSAEVEA
jgi:SNF family Na+-dependent transporter